MVSGARFTCMRCSKCCRHDPGYVFLSANDLLELCRALALEEGAFIERFCRWVDMGDHEELSLNETRSFDCVFWTQAGCSVYRARPSQCRTYPFWERIVESDDAWKAESAHCPGIGKGEARGKEFIEEMLDRRRSQPALRRARSGVQ
jgi:hypothetical protein